MIVVYHPQRIGAVDRFVVPEPLRELHEAEETEKRREQDDARQKPDLPAPRQLEGGAARVVGAAPVERQDGATEQQPGGHEPQPDAWDIHVAGDRELRRERQDQRAQRQRRCGQIVLKNARYRKPQPGRPRRRDGDRLGGFIARVHAPCRRQLRRPRA
jgi:hypothetical protein